MVAQRTSVFPWTFAGKCQQQLSQLSPRSRSKVVPIECSTLNQTEMQRQPFTEDAVMTCSLFELPECVFQETPQLTPRVSCERSKVMPLECSISHQTELQRQPPTEDEAISVVGKATTVESAQPEAPFSAPKCSAASPAIPPQNRTLLRTKAGLNSRRRRASAKSATQVLRLKIMQRMGRDLFPIREVISEKVESIRLDSERAEAA
jgi:hypothetical protein